MKTAILLGSGASVPASFPTTQGLTDLILSGKGVERHTDGSYFINSKLPMSCAVELANRMVCWLFAEAERYSAARNKRPINYETLFYLAKQASDEASGEMENPAIHRFMTEAKSDMLPLVEAANSENANPKKPYHLDVPNDLSTLFEETCNYISDIVWRSLCASPEPIDHLKIIVEACKSGHLTGISTLCHDTHLETHLSRQGIYVADGFADEENGVRYWNGDLCSKSKIPFLKLHGSVNWFRYCPNSSSSWYDERIGIPIDGDQHHTRSTDGSWQTAIDGRPLLLIGTFNKSTEYSQTIFLDLHHRFSSTLREADQLVICGYSFGDKGINSTLIEWYYAKRNRRFLIIHPDRKALLSSARGAVQEKWEEWEKGDSIEVMVSRLEDVDADKFLRRLNDGSENGVDR